VLLLVVAVLGGLAAGSLRPPVGAHGARLHLTRLPLLGAGAGGTALAHLLTGDLATLAMGLSLALLLAFALANSHLTGVVVIGLGLLLNLVAVVLNNGMPVRGGALVAADVVDRVDLATTELTGPRHLETPHDRLGVLGDVLPMPIGREVLSFGDLIVVAGAADAVRELARRRRRTWTLEERETYESTTTQLRAVHDWGTAPSGAPESGSQYSAKPDRTAPAAIDLTSPAATPGSRPLVATHSR
jgi:Family of unknown function (DUF5317)